ncbi:MAG: SRPBCC family protein [Flavobacteriaceae bacterium]|nr:SRPBCC family protein [Flavobacteriaceae bacterium]
MKLESQKKTVNKSSKELYDLLTNVENFKQFMPSSIEKFEADENSFLFALKGMPEIRLVLKEKEPFNKIVLAAASSKLPFTLTTKIDELSDSQSSVQLFFEGDFNPMMAMMLKGPLSKFIDTLSDSMGNL